MKNLGYYNGKVGLIEELSVPFNDRVHFFGDGVYDAGPGRNHVIFALDEHVDRFFHSAAMVNIQIPLNKEELKKLLNELVKKVEGENLFVYYQVTRGTEPRNFAYHEGPCNLWVMIRPTNFRDISQRVQLLSCEDTRFFHCNIKTLNLLPSVLYSQRAESQGCFETVLHRHGRVTECAHSNVHILKNGALYTAPLDNLILPGIARKHLIHMCHQLGIEVREEPYSLEELMNAEEILVTSSSNFCLAADRVDGKPVGGKQPEMVEALQKALLEEYFAATGGTQSFR